MKVIFALILFTFASYSQNIVPIENWDGNEVSNAYYKDTNNVMNNFEGTWLYTNGTTSLEVVLKKLVMVQIGNYYEDMLVGEYRYVENGVEIINTLNNINNQLWHDHLIYGNWIITSSLYLNCNDCLSGEKRVSLGIFDNTDNHTGEFILKKDIVNGQEAIKAFIAFDYIGSYQEGIAVPPPQLPWQQWYILIKQP